MWITVGRCIHTKKYWTNLKKKLYSMQIFITFKIHLQSSQVKNFWSTPLYIINTFGKLYNYILHGIPVIVIWFQSGRRSSWYSNVQYIQYMYLHRLGISFYKPLMFKHCAPFWNIPLLLKVAFLNFFKDTVS